MGASLAFVAHALACLRSRMNDFPDDDMYFDRKSPIDGEDIRTTCQMGRKRATLQYLLSSSGSVVTSVHARGRIPVRLLASRDGRHLTCMASAKA